MKLLKDNPEQIVIDNLPTKVGDYTHFEGLSLPRLERLFKFDTEGDVNGWELDWSSNFEFNGRPYSIWGSVRNCSFNIQLDF